MGVCVCVCVVCVCVCGVCVCVCCQGSTKYPFKSVVYCNIGDCHAMGQKPLTFVRQLLAACTYPELVKQEGTFPSDVMERAELILSHCGGHSIGEEGEEDW